MYFSKCCNKEVKHLEHPVCSDCGESCQFYEGAQYTASPVISKRGIKPIWVVVAVILSVLIYFVLPIILLGDYLLW
jgi:ribosomal protein L32